MCFKVETHNHPSAIEPYGGANTGIGGVIRDVLGTGLGAKPIANTDVFCFAPPDFPPEKLPPGVLHPRRVMQGVVAGVRDYGNRMGIPTVNGAISFRSSATWANPLVFCGTIGLIPVGMEEKAAKPGDLIVAVGGRTGRDGIHGATFSSAELTDRIGEGLRRCGADRQRHHRKDGDGCSADSAGSQACTGQSRIAGQAAFQVPSARWRGSRGHCPSGTCPAEVRWSFATPKSGSAKRRNGWCWLFRPIAGRIWRSCATVRTSMLSCSESSTATGRLELFFHGTAGWRPESALPA